MKIDPYTEEPAETAVMNIFSYLVAVNRSFRQVEHLFLLEPKKFKKAKL